MVTSSERENGGALFLHYSKYVMNSESLCARLPVISQIATTKLYFMQLYYFLYSTEATYDF